MAKYAQLTATGLPHGVLLTVQDSTGKQVSNLYPEADANAPDNRARFADGTGAISPATYVPNGTYIVAYSGGSQTVVVSGASGTPADSMFVDLATQAELNAAEAADSATYLSVAKGTGLTQGATKNDPTLEITTLNDTFDRSDGILGNDPRSGILWLGSGGTTPNISSNKMVAPVHGQTAYGTFSAARPIASMSGVLSFVTGGGTDATACPMVPASSSVASQAPWTLIHPQFTQTGYQIQKAINNVFTTLASGNWTTPIPIDGTQKTVSWRLDGTTLTLTGPNGEIVTVTDADLPTCNGRYGFFSIEPGDTNAPKGRWHRCTITELRSADSQENPPPKDFWIPSNGVAESYPRAFSGSNANTGLTSGVMYCSGIVLPAGVPIQRVSFWAASQAAVTPTHQWVALLDQEGRVLAVSADKTTEAWAANVEKQFVLTSQYTPSGSMPVWVGLVVVAATVPTLSGFGTSVSAISSYRPNPCGPGSSGQVSPPAVGTILGKPGAPTGYPYCVVG